MVCAANLDKVAFIQGEITQVADAFGPDSRLAAEHLRLDVRVDEFKEMRVCSPRVSTMAGVRIRPTTRKPAGSASVRAQNLPGGEKQGAVLGVDDPVNPFLRQAAGL
jgi:hypothetical protein